MRFNNQPLFIIVAESTVILAPIFHLGCFKASSLVTFSLTVFDLNSKSASRCGNNQLIDIFFFTLLMVWKIAECSESTGIKLTLFSLAFPSQFYLAATSDSLLEIAISHLCSIAFKVGSKPTNPEDSCIPYQYFLKKSKKLSLHHHRKT